MVRRELNPLYSSKIYLLPGILGTFLTVLGKCPCARYGGNRAAADTDEYELYNCLFNSQKSI